MPDSDAVSQIAPRRLLIRGVNWLGDAVMTTPALLRLRERFPETHVTLLTRDTLADLWLEHPAVNETISFARGDGVFAVAARLRGGDFDLALILPNSPRSAFEAWAARVPKRIGYARPWRNRLLTRAVPPRPEAVRLRKRTPAEIRRLINTTSTGPSVPLSPSAHQVHEYLHLAAALGASPKPLAPLLRVSDGVMGAVRQRFQLEHAVTWIGLNPGAEYGPAKRWPAERFAAAAREIQRRKRCGWLILGGSGDVSVAAEIEASLQSAGGAGGRGIAGDTPSLVRNVAGQTSLRELTALLKICRLLLTNDTGPMHVAAALGTPVVALFGSTAPELTRPGLPGDPRHVLLRSDAPCSPCFRRVCPIDFRCMTSIPVERTVESMLDTLASQNVV